MLRSGLSTGKWAGSLTESQKSYLRGLRYNIEKKAAHRPEKGGQSDHLKTSEQIAEELKVSPRAVTATQNMPLL